MMRLASSTALAITGALLSLGGCAQDAAAICSGAGGTYVGGTCSRWSPRQQAAQDACETSGGVYLRGDERCALGEGGP
jgi:hypothetical protein